MVDDANVLGALLDSWDRNNAIVVNLLGALPCGGMDAIAVDGGPTVAQLFAHIHFVRLVFVAENAPEFSRDLPQEEWAAERDATRLVEMLNDSATAVRDAVERKVRERQAMDLHYDHPVLMLQHLIWHEGYHHGQIKLALKISGQPLSDGEAGPVTWGLWMRKS